MISKKRIKPAVCLYLFFLNGAIDDVRIYARALTLEEIQALATN
jgi:hypothetical protein